ncbi:MAG: hypothetical protein QM731_08355 [Chitinophagaceae bacterium]
MINKEDSLLFGLENDQLDAIIDDLTLHFSGYRFFYAVDSYDFVHFFLPYLQKIEFTDVNINQLAREGIAYENFFSPSRSGSILLLEEYKYELLRIRDVYVGRLNGMLEASANFSSLSEQLKRLIDSEKSLSNIAAEDYNLFFLLVIYYQRKTEMKEVSFFQFIKRQVYIDTFSTGDETFNERADAAFENDNGQEFVDTIFDQFIESNRTYLNELSSEEQYKYRASAKTDIKAIEKILSANELISRDPDYNKTIFYYLSSTPERTPRIFRIINELYGRDLSFLKTFKKSGQIHRNIGQVFLFNLLVEEYPEDLNMSISIISLLKKIRLSETALHPGQHEESVSATALLDLLQKYKSFMEAHFIHGLITNYKNTMNDILQEVKDEGSNRLKSIITTLKEVIAENKAETSGVAFQYRFKKARQVMLLKDAVDGRSGQVSHIKIRFGNDIVRFHYHHLPYLLFIYDVSAGKLWRSFYIAMLEISDIDKDEETEIGLVIRFLQELFNSRASSNIRRNNYEFLMLTYIDFLSIKIPGEEDGPEEWLLVNILEQQLKMLQTSTYDSMDLTAHQGTPKKEITARIRAEFYYVLIWLFRRNLLFHKLFALEEVIRKQRITDARLNHGLGLGYESYFYHRGELEEDKDILQKAIHYLKEAKEGYELYLTKTDDKVINQLVMRNLIGTLNSIADSYLRFFQIDKQEASLLNARMYLESIKDLTTQAKASYDTLSIINNTEAELEYLEARRFADNGHLDMAKRKLSSAFKKYKKSVERVNSMQYRFHALKGKLDQLRTELNIGS